MFIRRQAFIDAGKFDPDYFIFMEESDLGGELGWQDTKIFCPKSIVYHKFSSTKDIVDPKFNNYLVRFHGTKNYIQTLIKTIFLVFIKNIASSSNFMVLSCHLSFLTGKFFICQKYL